MTERYSLACVKGRYEGESFPIADSVSIGRDPRRCRLAIPDSPDIGSLHCEIKVGPFGVTLTDMGSAGGTYVFGRRLSAGETVMLGDGDRFIIAEGVCEFKLLRDAAEAELPPLPQPPKPRVPVIAAIAVAVTVGVTVIFAYALANRDEFPDTPEREKNYGEQPESDKGIVGKWQLVEYGYRLEEGGGLGETVYGGFIIEFGSDGTFGGTYKGRYSVKGGTVTVGGKDYRFEIPPDDADRLTLSYDCYDETERGTVVEASMLFDRIK